MRRARSSRGELTANRSLVFTGLTGLLEKASRLSNFVTIRRLTGRQKSLNQIALTADGEAEKPFEPPAGRNLGFGVQPMGQVDDLVTTPCPGAGGAG